MERGGASRPWLAVGLDEVMAQPLAANFSAAMRREHHQWFFFWSAGHTGTRTLYHAFNEWQLSSEPGRHCAAEGELLVNRLGNKAWHESAIRSVLINDVHAPFAAANATRVAQYALRKAEHIRALLAAELPRHAARYTQNASHTCYVLTGHDFVMGEAYALARLLGPHHMRVVRLRRPWVEQLRSFASESNYTAARMCRGYTMSSRGDDPYLMCPGERGVLAAPPEVAWRNFTAVQRYSWWIDEVERQWRAFAAYYPAIPKLELEWSKETGGITGEHLEAVAALARPPLWQTRGVNASGVLRHSNAHMQPRARKRASSSMDPGDESVMAREVAKARSLTVRRFHFVS